MPGPTADITKRTAAELLDAGHALIKAVLR